MNDNYELVDQAFCKCVSQKLHKSRMFSPPTPCETLYRVWHAKGLVGNGGFHSFFSVCSKKDVESVVAAYILMNLEPAGRCISDAYLIFNAAMKKTGKTRDYDSIRQACDSELSEIEQDFYGMEIEIINKAANYVRDKLGKM